MSYEFPVQVTEQGAQADLRGIKDIVSAIIKAEGQFDPDRQDVAALDLSRSQAQEEPSAEGTREISNVRYRLDKNHEPPLYTVEIENVTEVEFESDEPDFEEDLDRTADATASDSKRVLRFSTDCDEVYEASLEAGGNKTKPIPSAGVARFVGEVAFALDVRHGHYLA